MPEPDALRTIIGNGRHPHLARLVAAYQARYPEFSARECVELVLHGLAAGRGDGDGRQTVLENR
ncbi:hypothetical protein [Streptomyces albireticuli]|uniref:hypothetical protein n=1 Tax=Streptomyces albireticuli TaxID=1940 RepID=UPI00117F8D92|nr:hypothetical protein [Streptomyces albireticuli]MCD9145926.1 hypothetical protein [Streptomyces albireticuli]MCD9166096.1 hypothetical protein [Streptomyces albireticuli]MCD9196376.1 hypothetical protein [Streptomyces albireticuli]